MKPHITQILDSRGNPTIQACLKHITTAVPSGASTGIHEALELRDGGSAYGGKGVSQAIRNAKALSSLIDWSSCTVSSVDSFLVSEDGTPNKSRFGANAILSLSLLSLHAQAHREGVQPFEVVSRLAQTTPSLPLPFANIINGGVHAQNDLMFQEFMIVPTTAKTFAEATQIVSEVYHELKRLIATNYSPSQTALGDEGGFAPMVTSPSEVCSLLMQASSNAGHSVSIALDAAASEFHSKGLYEAVKGSLMSANELTQLYVSLCKEFPIISIEDPFDQDDVDAFVHLLSELRKAGIQTQVVGDDLTVSQTKRVQMCLEKNAISSLLLKINQVGTISESIDSAQLVMQSGGTVMVSHRSGETEDSTISDIAVGLGCGQIKLGAPARGERTAKYNRLLTIESLYGLELRNDFQ